MKKYDLNGKWKMKILGRDEALTGEEGIEADVPGSLYSNLLSKGLIEDPFYRANETALLPLNDNDVVFEREFDVTEEQMSSDALILRFEGIDTIADIYVNDMLIGHAENMHRTYEFDLFMKADCDRADGRVNGVRSKGCVFEGKNTLKVVIYSPVAYIRNEQAKVYTGGASESMEGFPHIRKAHCMFGWDWGPRIPDSGIFRDVSLLEIRSGRINSVYIKQEHLTRDCKTGKVRLYFSPDISLFGSMAGRREGDKKDEILIKITVTGPDGRQIMVEEPFRYRSTYRIGIDDPKLWWPRGYGDQPLYGVSVDILKKYGNAEKIIDTWNARIGLRTMTVNTDEDEYGNCFAHEVNGVKIFAMGADYIPEDSLLSRCSHERTRRLLEDAAWANHNCIRVWGGGYYPDDRFFDICDELGLIVWQDFMFACASYELDDEFEKNVTEEIRQNIIRIRHHACLGIWCGNNEMETQTLDGAWHPSMKQRSDYTKLFEYIIPKLVKENDPETFYWPSSPSSGGNWDNPWDEHRGDVHYWDVWHGEKPFTDYRNYRFRYLSEFGFQSFPDIRTVESFSLPEDRNIFSYVMEMHQRNRAANGKILKYLSAMYLYPGSFEMLLYASQLLQADAIRYGVEHFRRHRGECMGSVVWQLNDIWPVASWSSIDYYGRWKALHYAERRMFSPVMISCEEIGELSERPYCIEEPRPIEKGATLHVTNETMEEVKGTARWALCLPDSTVLTQGSCELTIPSLSGIWLDHMDLFEYDEHVINLAYSFEIEGKTVSDGTVIFTAPKHYGFLDPELTLKYDLSKMTITVNASNYAKGVCIEGTDGDVFLSDNFFDMEKGSKTVNIIRGNATKFRVRSVYDMAK
ncbi:MAG: glycoside hydrolase family 2 protein [Lachnospiraceae bacterium]|nr:glycoside hydrolase family 2 protein [Lachnospiraceae bacterium]